MRKVKENNIDLGRILPCSAGNYFPGDTATSWNVSQPRDHVSDDGNMIIDDIQTGEELMVYGQNKLEEEIKCALSIPEDMRRLIDRHLIEQECKNNYGHRE